MANRATPNEAEKTYEEPNVGIFNALYDKDKHILKAVLVDNVNNKKYSCILAKKLDRSYFIDLENSIESLYIKPPEEPPEIEFWLNFFKSKGIELKENDNAELIENININNYIYVYKTIIIIPARGNM